MNQRPLNLSRPYRLSFAVMVAALTWIALPASAQRGGNASAPPPPDYITSVDPRLFSVPSNPTALTRLWANAAFTAMGHPEKLKDIKHVELIVDLEGSFGTMTLEVTSDSNGAVRFKQIVFTEGKDVPERTLEFTIAAGSNRAIVGDGTDDPSLTIPAEALSAIRRAGDMWNPMLAILGQFERVASIAPELVDGRPCIVLNMSHPRLDGFTAGKVWLDAATYMPVAVETSVLRDIPVSGKYTIVEWQSVSGVQVPRVLNVQGPGGACTVTFSKVGLYKEVGPI